MSGACYSGVAEAFRQAFIGAVHSAAKKTNNIHVELELTLMAETSFSQIMQNTLKEFSTLTSPEAEEYMSTNILRSYENIIHSPLCQEPSHSWDIPPKNALGVDLDKELSQAANSNKNDFKESAKGQSHKNHKGGWQNGKKRKR